ncbi:MAG: alanyl-tRNA editing protein [Promethearchaeota archaeon]
MTEKLYWDDAYQTKFEAKLIAIMDEGVILDKTLFYPESGNQASDRGYLTFGEKKFEVIKVTKENEEILHHISSDLKNKINIGDTVKGEIDWEYRYGIMKAHTSQHIFSAIFKNTNNIDTIRALLNFEEVFLQISQHINFEQLRVILTEVNKICSSNNLRLTSNIISSNESKKYSKKVRSNIPDEEKIRLIEIKDLDLVCCGGTHVKNTAEIGPIFVYEFKKGNEIRYVVGNKAIEMSSQIDIDVITLANYINSPLAKLKGLLKKRLDFLDNILEQNKDLSLKLLELISKTPSKRINDVDLFYLDFNVDIKILNKSLDYFPSNSLIIVRFEENKIRLLSLNEIIDTSELMQELIKKFSGKGGGNPKSSQGFLKKMPENLLLEIETLINSLKLLK